MTILISPQSDIDLRAASVYEGPRLNPHANREGFRKIWTKALKTFEYEGSCSSEIVLVWSQRALHSRASLPFGSTSFGTAIAVDACTALRTC